jgi:hypothetical protein
MTAAATPAAGETGTAVPAKGQLLLKAGRLLVFVMLAKIWWKGPDAADGPRNGADGAQRPASG